MEQSGPALVYNIAYKYHYLAPNKIMSVMLDHVKNCDFHSLQHEYYPYHSGQSHRIEILT